MCILDVNWEDADCLMASMWFLCFGFVLFFLLVNMFAVLGYMDPLDLVKYPLDLVKYLSCVSYITWCV